MAKNAIPNIQVENIKRIIALLYHFSLFIAFLKELYNIFPLWIEYLVYPTD